MSLHVCDADYTPKPKSLTRKSANFNGEVKVAKINGTRKALVGSGALPVFAGQGFAGFSNDKKYLVDKFGSKMIKEVIKKTKVLDRAAESASMRTGLSALRREVHGLKMQEREKREHTKPSKLF